MDKPIVLYRVICECIDEHIFDVTTNDFETIVYHDKRSQPRLFTLSSLLTILNSNHETIIYHTIVNQYQLWKIKKRLIAYRLFLLKHIVIDDIAILIILNNYQLLLQSYKQKPCCIERRYSYPKI